MMVNPNETAQLMCTVDANPIANDTIKWVREGFDGLAGNADADDGKARVSTKWDGGNTLYLTILNATETDAGEFDCVVDNGIGSQVKNTSFLVVKRKRNYY